MKYKVSQTLTFSKTIEAKSKEEAEGFWSEKDADTIYGELKIKEIPTKNKQRMRKIHAIDHSIETYCGLSVDGLDVLDVNIVGNINKITCNRCIHIAFKD